ncbi:PDZ domain-containing protein [Candidatus Gracilibacteria bacterium]|nr:PDZ domain-containing protein [Candidatus Gracilibacteria bacterium]
MIYRYTTLLSLLLLMACSRPLATIPSPEPVATATALPSATPLPPSPTSLPPTPTTVPSATPLPSVTPTLAPSPEPLLPTATLIAISTDERQQLFTEVWELVRDRYLYEDYRGVDWDAVRAEYEPQIQTVQLEDFYGLLRQMIVRLGDEHSRFMSPQEVAAEEARFNNAQRYGGIGAEVRDTEEGGLIIKIAPGGPAEQAGLQPRDLIVLVEGTPFNDPAAFGPGGPISVIRGDPGTSVTLTVRSSAGEREVTVVRQIIGGDAFPEVTSQRLPDSNIGLVSVDTFYADALDGEIRSQIEALLAEGPLDGLIIDVRSNGGGFVHLMRNTIALFVDGGSIGSTVGRDVSDEQLIPNGQTIAAMIDVPIAVLTGPETVSAAEMFAAGMQVTGRAVVIGEPSAGNTENLYSYTFDDRSRLMLAEVAYQLPDGTLIEGRGVIPDVVISAEWWRYNVEDDPQIQAAVESIQASGLRSQNNDVAIP